MDLKGAKIRNIYHLCTDITSDDKTSLRVKIPHYQRPYKWGKEKIKLLISDFFENYNNVKRLEDSNDTTDEEKYFAGSIVTVKKDDQDKYHELIDGQQRITTVFLTNYIKFLLLRSYISQLIYSRKKLYIFNAFDDMIKSANNLYKNGEKDIKELKEEIITRIEEIDDNSESINEEYDELLKIYKEKIYLPLKNLDDDDYPEEYKERLSEFLEGKEFCLKYSRESFNKKLRQSLIHVNIELTFESGPNLEIINEEGIKEDDTIKQYITAIKTIFNSFEQGNNNAAPPEKVKKMKDRINTFLDYLNFCLIQTGNTNDAYTLFEVLNDRALELDDLDLIKNMFYKEYCQHNRSKDEKEIDSNIEELEELWGDEIFSRNTSDWKKKLVSFLGTVFLTGNTKTRHNQKAKYREIIKKYLNHEYSNKNQNYDFTDIKYEFKIFQAIKTIINKYDIPYQKKGTASLEAENTPNVSITYKTLHFLNALKYFGVMSALINIILMTYIDNSEDEFSIEDFQKFLENLKNDVNYEEDKFKKIHECASNLWRLAMLSKNYKEPRKFAKKVIERINYNNFDLSIEISIDVFEQVQKEFKTWTDRWYKGNKNDFKIKVLFLKLIHSKKEDNKIIYTNNRNIFTNIENLELDHFEPKEPKDDNEKKYFEPNSLGDNRDNYVDQLGNFMLLEKDKNSSLSNRPADKSFEYYKDMGVGKDNHWLVEEMDNLLESNNKITNDNQGQDVRVPNENFFNNRKKRLQNYFFTIIKMTFKENEKDIVEI